MHGKIEYIPEVNTVLKVDLESIIKRLVVLEEAHEILRKTYESKICLGMQETGEGLKNTVLFPYLEDEKVLSRVSLIVSMNSLLKRQSGEIEL